MTIIVCIIHYYLFIWTTFVSEINYSILFYLILFCSVLFCSVLFCSVLFCSVLFYSGASKVTVIFFGTGSPLDETVGHPKL